MGRARELGEGRLELACDRTHAEPAALEHPPNRVDLARTDAGTLLHDPLGRARSFHGTA